MLVCEINLHIGIADIILVPAQPRCEIDRFQRSLLLFLQRLLQLLRGRIRVQRPSVIPALELNCRAKACVKGPLSSNRVRQEETLLSST